MELLDSQKRINLIKKEDKDKESVSRITHFDKAENLMV